MVSSSSADAAYWPAGLMLHDSRSEAHELKMRLLSISPALAVGRASMSVWCSGVGGGRVWWWLLPGDGL